MYQSRLKDGVRSILKVEQHGLDILLVDGKNQSISIEIVFNYHKLEVIQLQFEVVRHQFIVDRIDLEVIQLLSEVYRQHSEVYQLFLVVFQLYFEVFQQQLEVYRIQIELDRIQNKLKQLIIYHRIYFFLEQTVVRLLILMC